MLYYGRIGYVSTSQDPDHPTTWNESVSWRYYPGELSALSHRWMNSAEDSNSNINITNKLSIIADPYMCQNASAIRYVELMGSAWYVDSIQIEYPRIILSVGGVANVVLPHT